jgi:hypothetical protein
VAILEVVVDALDERALAFQELVAVADTKSVSVVVEALTVTAD